VWDGTKHRGGALVPVPGFRRSPWIRNKSRVIPNTRRGVAGHAPRVAVFTERGLWPRVFPMRMLSALSSAAVCEGGDVCRDSNLSFAPLGRDAESNGPPRQAVDLIRPWMVALRGEAARSRWIRQRVVAYPTRSFERQRVVVRRLHSLFLLCPSRGASRSVTLRRCGRRLFSGNAFG
jgi:hypothetical protein